MWRGANGEQIQSQSIVHMHEVLKELIKNKRASEATFSSIIPLETKWEEERGLLATWVPFWLAVGVGKPLVRRMT